MSANIKTWQERTGNHNVRPGSVKHMIAEIAELHAALAATAPTVAVDGLLPCPFCGESCIEGPRPEYIERAAGYGYTVYNVGHAQLSSSRKKCIAWVTAESQSEAIERWNARAKLSAGVAIPEGWALVPVEPTDAIICAIEAMVDQQLIASGSSPKDMVRQDGSDIWEAAIAAAPSPDQQGGIEP